MPTFRYTTTGNWYKGNTHIHSTASDGGKNFIELAQIYHDAGYHFLFRTDHWVTSHVREDLQEYPLLWLDGIELDGPDHTGAGFHVVGIGAVPDLRQEMGLENAMQAIRAQGGMLILAHPMWMGNSFEDALRWPFDGVEVHNNICWWLNGKGEGKAYWNAMLERNPNTLAFSSDDAHLNFDEPACDGGWVVVNAPQCTTKAIMAAIRAGNYYSSCGPEIYAMDYDGDQVSIQCSPVQYIRLVGPASFSQRLTSQAGNRLTRAAFSVPQDWAYAYLELEDAQGRCAWSNPLFIYDRGQDEQ